MNKKIISAIIGIFSLLLGSCTGITPPIPSETPSNPSLMADTFFSGCAYLDENGNGTIDAEEQLVGGMAFTITFKSGMGFGGQTSDGYCASILVPSALPEEAWPLPARMEVPEGSIYKLVGPSEIILENGQTQADFLFTIKQTPPLDTPLPGFPRSTFTPDPCTGWWCSVTGFVFDEPAGSRIPLEGVTVTLRQTSFCSPTSGQHQTTTNPDGSFEFNEVYFHDTDRIQIQFESEEQGSAKWDSKGNNCLFCSCFGSPLEIILQTSADPEVN